MLYPLFVYILHSIIYIIYRRDYTMRTETILRSTPIKGRVMPIGTHVIFLDNGMVICSHKLFKRVKTKNGKTIIVKTYDCLVYLNQQDKWVLTHDKNQYTEKVYEMHKAYIDNRHKNFPTDKKYVSYAGMMKHSRKHKRGSGGQFCEYTQAVTDYECTKYLLHDFNRGYYG